VWLYFRFPLSLRLVEEVLLERGIVVSYETVRRWAMKFGPEFARRLRRKVPGPYDIWYLDEVVVTMAGERRWLWRAVDQNGCVLDEVVQSRRDTKAATRLLKRLLWQQGSRPKRIICENRLSMFLGRGLTKSDPYPEEIDEAFWDEAGQRADAIRPVNLTIRPRVLAIKCLTQTRPPHSHNQLLSDIRHTDCLENDI
jgi:putative transposase